MEFLRAAQSTVFHQTETSENQDPENLKSNQLQTANQPVQSNILTTLMLQATDYNNNNSCNNNIQHLMYHVSIVKRQI